MISVAIVRQNVSKLSPKDCIALRHRVTHGKSFLTLVLSYRSAHL